MEEIIDNALEKHKHELHGTLTAIESLAQHRTRADGALPKLMNALMTRNYYTGFAIIWLSDDYHNGSAAIDLARQMVEDMINLEWMMVNNPEKQAAKFDTFVAIDRMNAMREAGLINLNIKDMLTDEEMANIINEDKAARKKLGMQEDEERWSYNKKNFEDMVTDIKAKIDQTPLTEDNLNRILWYYIQGNRKNHTSPNELLVHLQPDKDVVQSLKGDMQYALYIAHAVLFTIAMHYTDWLLSLNPNDTLAKTTQEKLIEQHKAGS
jgi:hypothetical protein